MGRGVTLKVDIDEVDDCPEKTEFLGIGPKQAALRLQKSRAKSAEEVDSQRGIYDMLFGTNF